MENKSKRVGNNPFEIADTLNLRVLFIQPFCLNLLACAVSV